MAHCPNCGRQTSRTSDWACQWCGYPLLYGSYPKIPQTFKELQEERHRFVPDESEPEVTLEAEPKLKIPHAPEREAKPRKEPLETPPEMEAAPAPKAAAESRTVPEIKRAPEPVPPPRPERIPLTELMKAVPDSVPEIRPVPEVQLAAESAVTPEPGFAPPPQVDVGAILEKTTLTAEELDLVYQADKVAAEAKFADKVLTVSGVVDRLFVNDSLGIHYVVLTGAQRRSVWQVRCTFAAQYIAELKKLNPGQPLTVQGKYGGYGKNIILKDCALLQ